MTLIEIEVVGPVAVDDGYEVRVSWGIEKEVFLYGDLAAASAGYHDLMRLVGMVQLVLEQDPSASGRD